MEERYYAPHVNNIVYDVIEAYAKKDFSGVRRISRHICNKESTNEIGGGSSEFHNAGSVLARNNFYDIACQIIQVGINKFEWDADLYADFLHFGLECKPLAELKKAYDKLMELDHADWGWRPFSFALDYLQYRARTEKGDERKATIEEAKTLVSAFKKQSESFDELSDKEKSYMSDFELQTFCKVPFEERRKILETAIEKLNKNCPQCALKLADYEFENAKWKKCCEYAETAVNAQTAQNTISMGYAYYIYAMANESKVRENNNGIITPSLVGPVFRLYKSAKSALIKEDGREHLLNRLEIKLNFLEQETGVKSET